MNTHNRMIRPAFPAALPAALAALLVAGCSAPATEDVPEQAAPQDAFFDALASHCGKAYAGELVSSDAADADFAGAPMVMHVAECSEDRIAVPFHVQLANERGKSEWDRSRTWIITRTPEGLRLKHDHRHEDGEPDAVTMYGGDTTDDGTPRAQDFPVDAESIALFEREGLTASVTNVWTVEVDPAGTPDARFAYQLQRTGAGGAPEDRLFRVEFDLTEAVDTPPAAWGHEEQ
jgi:hypothetical protein